MRDCHNRNLERSVYIQSPRPLKRVLHDGLGFIVSMPDLTLLSFRADDQ
jgi:hypothetical protein